MLEGDEGAVEWKTYRARVPDAGRGRLRGRRGRQRGARGCPTPSQPRPRRSTINRRRRRGSPGPPASPEEGDASDGAGAMTTRTRTRRRIPPPPRKFVVSESEGRPRGSPRASSRHGPRARRRAPRGRRAARAAPAPRTPPQATAERSSRIPRLHPGSAPSASAADVLDLNSASDDLLSQHPWGDDGGDGWADAMGTPDFQKKENKLGSPSKLPVARRAAGARRVSAPLVQTTSPNVAYAPGVPAPPRRRRRAGSCGWFGRVRGGRRRHPRMTARRRVGGTRRAGTGPRRSGSRRTTSRSRRGSERSRTPRRGGKESTWIFPAWEARRASTCRGVG